MTSITASPAKSVDKLVITFLVDNTIEWMTKLPPGFTHEVHQHVKEHIVNVDDVVGVPLLDLDHFCCGAHGFSALIETQIGDEPSHLTLFDTGPDSHSLIRNIAAMHVPVRRVERVITSHWHVDHTGGLLSFLKYVNEHPEVAATRFSKDPSSPVIVDVHPDRPAARGIAPPPTFDKVIAAIRDPTFEAMEELGGIVEKHPEGHAVADGAVWVSGEIPRVTDFEGGLLGGSRWQPNSSPQGGVWVQEPHIMDERYAAVDVAGKGLVIFSACSHAGIVNVVKDAVRVFSRPIYMVIGGLHLAGPEFGDRIPRTVNFLAKELKPSPAFVLPMHCSGFRAKVALEEALGDGCVPAGTGHKVEIVGNREDDARLFPPTF